MTIAELNEKEQAWMHKLQVYGEQLLSDFGGKNGVFLDKLDAAYTEWSKTEKSQDEVNMGLNSFGVMFGNYLRKSIPSLEWKVITDDYGTELGLYRAKNEITLFPANMITKRYHKQETGFLKGLAESMIRDILQLKDHSRENNKK